MGMTDLSPGNPGGWVLATPFRAHYEHLIAASGLSWRVIALHARIPERVALALLRGRRGRPLPRLAPDIAHRLLSLSPEGLEQELSRPVPAYRSRQRISTMRSLGIGDTPIAHSCHLTPEDVGALSHPCTAFTTRGIELQVWAAAVELGVSDYPNERAA